MHELPAADKVRLDKWLWAARFFKTRSLAADEIGKGRVTVNGQPAKASRELRAGDRVELRQGSVPRTVLVKALSETRGPAPLAQGLYAETADSLALRQRLAEQRRQGVEPAHAI
ncbi:RNA-binding S4 domain-containing protein, partial [Polaromonas sp.]|uniref:RNA-binding S4 domain-containing protein n=1 Tax=Polaromonas sp. TaxID=1869339 RepID=UPI00286AA51A